MPRLHVRRADRRLEMYLRRINGARTEKSMLNALVGWLMGEYHAAGPERRPHLMKRLKALAHDMNEEARK